MTSAVGRNGRVSANATSVGRRLVAAGGGFALWAFAIRVAAAGLAFLSQIVLARIVGEDAYGAVAAAVTVLGVAAAFCVMGLDTAAQKFVPQYKVRGYDALLRGFVRRAPLAPFGLGFLVGAVGVGLFHERDPVLAMAFASLPAVAYLFAQEGIAKALDRPVVALAPNFLMRPVLVLALVGGAATLGLRIDAVGVMVAMFAATLVAMVVQHYAMAPRLSALVLPGARAVDARHWLAVCTPILIGDLGALVAISADVIALSLFRADEEVGIYFAAVKSLALVQFVAYAVSNAVAHRVSALHVSGDRAALRSYVAKACLATFVPSVAFAIVLVAAGEFVLGLFGEAFVAAWPAMTIVAVGAAILAAVGPAERVLNMIGGERGCAVVYVVSGLVAIGLAGLLVPQHGMIGAAVGLAATMVVQAIGLGLALRVALAR